MSDFGSTNWSETDASNNAAVPNGWPEGMNPSDVNNAARANMGAEKRFWVRTNSVKTTAGTTTAYTLTYGVAAASYYDGEEFSFIVNATCGATPTLNINGLGAKNIRKWTAGAYANCAASDLLINQPVRVRYNLADDKFDLLFGAISPADILFAVAAAVALAVPTGTAAPCALRVAPSGWLLCNAAAVSRATYPALLAALVFTSTVTMTIASPCVVTWNAHGMNNGDPVKFSTSGALPTGLSAATTYYLVSSAANSFSLAATPGGTAINTSGSQSGVHTAVSAPFGDGDGTTTFNVPDLRGRIPVGHDVMGNAAASRVTFAASALYGASLGYSGGEQAHALITAELAAHTHGTPSNVQAGNDMLSGAGLAAGLINDGATGSTGSGTAHNNMQPTSIFNWIIKT